MTSVDDLFALHLFCVQEHIPNDLQITFEFKHLISFIDFNSKDWGAEVQHSRHS